MCFAKHGVGADRRYRRTSKRDGHRGSGRNSSEARRKSAGCSSDSHRLSGASLARADVTGVAQVNNIVPGLLIQPVVNNSLAVTMRGLGSNPGGQSFDQSVAAFLDGVYAAHAREHISGILDLERIEAVKGTQTALLGKNTSLGALSFVSRKPGASFSYDLTGSREFERESNRLEGGVDVPLTKDISVRVAAFYSDQGGWAYNSVTGKDGPRTRIGAGRITLAWRPTDAVDASLVYEHQRLRTRGQGFEVVVDRTGGAAARAAATGVPGFETLFDQRTNASSPLAGEPRDEQDTDRAALTVDYNLGAVTLTSLTGYTWYDSHRHNDVDFLPSDYSNRFEFESDRKLSQEFRITSDASKRLSYVAGVYALHDVRRLNQSVANSATWVAPGAYAGALHEPSRCNCQFAGRDPVNVTRRAYRTALAMSLALMLPVVGAEAQPMSVTRGVLLGTAGGPVSRPLRSQPASALVVRGRVYLIDLGNGVLGQLAKAGLAITDVDAVLITHNHFDHNADLGAFMAFDWLAGREAPVPIVGPPGTLPIAEAALGAFRNSEEIFSAEVPGRALPTLSPNYPVSEATPGLAYKDDLITVTAVENSHYAAMPEGAQIAVRNKSYSYRIQTPDRVIVFTGDTGRSSALAKLAAGADVLVSEVLDVDAITRYVNGRAARENWPQARRIGTLAHHMEGHLPAEELGKLATEAGVKKVVLTHFVPTPVDTLDTSAFVAGVRRYYAGEIVAGEDLAAF